MNGPQHYAAAERLLEEGRATVQKIRAANDDRDRRDDLGKKAAGIWAQAQVHATLALAAATAYPAVKDWCGDDGDDSRAWAKATAPEQPTASGGHVTNGVSF